MHTFFHGWRRKAGVVSLGVALAVFGMWVRSCIVDDLVDIRIAHIGLQLVSRDERLSWSFHKSSRQLAWATFSPRAPLRPEHQVSETHYLALIVPPMVLSAYLILWKPRKQPSHA